MRARMQRGALNLISSFSLGLLCLGFFSLQSSAEPSVRYYTENGITYKETRTTVRRPVVERRLEQREKTVYREKVTTSYEPHTQLSYTPHDVPLGRALARCSPPIQNPLCRLPPRTGDELANPHRPGAATGHPTGSNP